MEPREFICEDCKSHVFSYGDHSANLCYMCNHIRNMQLTIEEETKLREFLDCELEEETPSAAELGK